MKFKEVPNKVDTFYVPSHTNNLIVYQVSLWDCNCPAFKWHEINPCKHMDDLIEEIMQEFGSIDEFNDREGERRIIDFSDGAEAFPLAEEFGESLLNDLKSSGIIYESHGKLFHI